MLYETGQGVQRMHTRASAHTLFSIFHRKKLGHEDRRHSICTYIHTYGYALCSAAMCIESLKHFGPRKSAMTYWHTRVCVCVLVCLKKRKENTINDTNRNVYIHWLTQAKYINICLIFAAS